VRVPPPARPLVALAVIASAEAACLTGYGLFTLVEALRLGATGPAAVSNGPAMVLEVLLFVAFGSALSVVARGWWGERHWARAPFLLAQVMAVLIGYQLAQSSATASRIAGIAMAVVAIIGIVIALTGPVTRAIEE
jgi:hypothetical protein